MRYAQSLTKAFRSPKKFNFHFACIFIFNLSGFYALTESKIGVFPDSGGYLIGSGGDNWGNLSFTGNSVRAWPTQIVYLLGPNNQIRVYIQTIIFLSAISFFIYIVNFKRNTLGAYFSTFLICAIFLSNNVFQWNLTILSESSTLSFTIFGLSFFFLSLGESKFRTAFAFIGLIFLTLASLVRVQLLITLFVCILVWILTTRQYRAKIFLALTSLLAVVYVLGLNQNINNYWGGGAGQTTKNTTSYYFLTAYQTKNDALTNRLFNSLPDAAPRCLRSQESRAPYRDAPGPYVFQSQQHLTCLEGVNWLNDNFINHYISFLIRNPIHIMETAATYWPESISQAYYAESNSVVPPALQALWMTNPNWVVDSSPFYLWVVGPILSLIFLASHYGSIYLRRQSINLLLWVSFLTSLTVTYLFMNAELARIAVTSVYPMLLLSVTIIFNSNRSVLR